MLDMGPLMYAILGAATAIKVVLFIYCFALKGQSDSMLALAEDHSNDIVSNLGAIACGAIASISPTVWWVPSHHCQFFFAMHRDSSHIHSSRKA